MPIFFTPKRINITLSVIYILCYFAEKYNYVMGWISALASLAGTVASGVGSAMANKSEKEQIERERGEANHWYNMQLYQDPTKRADYSAMMNQLALALKRKNQTEESKRTILGGTQEGALAMQQQNANAMANVAEQQMANQAKRIDTLNAQKRSENVAYDNQQAALRARQFETWGNLANNAAKSFGGFNETTTTGKTANGANGVTGLEQFDGGAVTPTQEEFRRGLLRPPYNDTLYA